MAMAPRLLGILVLFTIVNQASAAWFFPYPCKPYECGGDTGKRCPTVACTSSTISAASGPGGCAMAGAVVKATAISKSYFNQMVTDLKDDIAVFCGNPCGETLTKTAQAVAFSMAAATVSALSQFSLYVCTCSSGPGYAKSSIASVVQSVAQATSSAYAKALVGVAGQCDMTNTIAYAYADSFSMAVAIERAILQTYESVETGRMKGCKTSINYEIQRAVAESTVCVVATAFAKAMNVEDNDPNGNVAQACSSGAAISGVPGISTDPIKCPVDCTCPAGTRGVPPDDCGPDPDYGKCSSIGQLGCSPGCTEVPNFATSTKGLWPTEDGKKIQFDGLPEGICISSAGSKDNFGYCVYDGFCSALETCSCHEDCADNPKAGPKYRCVQTCGTSGVCMYVATQDTCKKPQIYQFEAVANIMHPPCRPGDNYERGAECHPRGGADPNGSYFFRTNLPNRP